MRRKVVVPEWFQGPVGWARTVLLLIALGGGAALAVAAIEANAAAWERENYRPVRCYIEECRITKESGHDHRNLPGKVYVPYVKYQYEIDGTTYTGVATRGSAKPLMTAAAVEEFQQKFGPGMDSECYVHPTDPAKSMLELPTDELAERITKFGGIAVFLGLTALAVLELALRVNTKPKPRPTPQRSRNLVLYKQRNA